MHYNLFATTAKRARSVEYRWLIFGLFLIQSVPGAQAQSVTNVAVGSTILQAGTSRLGINLSLNTFYDSGQMMKNLIFRNPGFEGEIYQSTIRCAGGTATSCTDENAVSGWPAGFWNGATYQVFWGSANGRSGNVISSTAPGGGSGVTLNLGDSGVAPAEGDYLIVRQTVPGGVTDGWWPSMNGGSITTELVDLPPGTTGKQAARLTALGSGESAQLASYFDSTAGLTFTLLNGTYVLQFKAKGAGGTNQIQLNVNRNGNTFLNQTVTLTGAWSVYSIPFTAVDAQGATGTVGVTFSTAGQSAFLLDDVSLTPATGDPSNPTAFRDPVIATLRNLAPGVIRYWADQLGETMDNLIADPYGRVRAGYSTWATEKDDIGYGLHEFLQLCQTVGADPWFVVPIVFTPAEAANLIEYLAGSSTTPYGAKRAARGQTNPWTASFGKIHLEFGNEAWNGTFKGGSIEYPQPYGNRAQTIFAAMRGSSSFNAANFDLVLGGQAVNPGRNQDTQNNCNNNDSFAVAPYQMNQVDNYADNEQLFGPLFAEPEMIALPGGYMYQNQQAIQASSHPVPLAIYEVNLSTTLGSITQSALDQLTPSTGAGIAVADNMLQQLRGGVLTQMLFALPQYRFLRSDGSQVKLWGSVVDMGVTNRMRPQFLALQLINKAIGGAMLQTAHSGADPVWNQPLLNGIQLNNAHYLESFAFAQGSSRSLVVLNLHRTLSLAVTFSGVNRPRGTVSMSRLRSANLQDTNETANNVAIATSTLTAFDAGSPFSLPSGSITVLTWRADLSPSRNAEQPERRSPAAAKTAK
jgi:hypothetical protein